MNIALVVTVRNEADILGFNLRYHRHAGVGRIYVFLDGTTDATAASISGLPDLHIRPSVTAAELDGATLGNPDLRYILDDLAVHHCARQMLNAWWAARDARTHGHEWLLSLDADELVCTHPAGMPEDVLRLMLGQVPPAIDAIRFLPLEVVQSRMAHPRGVFADETRFQTLFRQADEGIVALDEPLRRPVLDPASGEIREVTGYLGHTTGKVAVRLSGDLVPASVHGFNSPGGAPLREANAAWLLHYNMFSFERFVSKYRAFSEHPDRFVSGAPVPWTLRAWRDLVNSPGVAETELREYYRRWIMLDESAISAGMARRPPTIIEVTAPSRFAASLGPQDGGADPG